VQAKPRECAVRPPPLPRSPLTHNLVTCVTETAGRALRKARIEFVERHHFAPFAISSPEPDMEEKASSAFVATCPKGEASFLFCYLQVLHEIPSRYS